VKAMSESNQNLKDSFDRYIGYERLVNETDKDKFYEKLQNQQYINNKKHWIPKLISVILIIGVTSALYMFSQYSNVLEQADDPTKRHDAITSHTISIDEIQQKVNNIKSKFQLGMSKKNVETEFGVPTTYAVVGEGNEISRSSYIYYLNNLKSPFDEVEWGDSKGKYGLTFNILWEKDTAINAYISFLTEQGRSLISFKDDGTVYMDGHFVENSKYQIEASDYLVDAIAESINKEPKDVTEEDLLKVKNLKLEPWNKAHYSFVAEHDIPVLKAMENLETLHLKQVIFSIDVISNFENLSTFIIDEVPFLSLGKLNKLNDLKVIEIKNTRNDISEIYVTGLAKSKSLETFIIDNKDNINGWEALVDAGIEVKETSK
jgi:hypothetical protein